MIAYATDDQGHREILGVGVYANESKKTWRSFIRDLKARGLRNVLMITSDAHEGLCDAISKEFPQAAWQRCQFHFSKNIAEKAPKKYQAGIRSELTAMFNCSTIEEARRKRDSIIADYQDVAESAMTCLDEGFESSMTVMVLPKYLRQYFRTSNHIERINKELKRRSNVSRSNVMGVFPNEASILRLMGSVLMELNDAAQARRALSSQKTYNELMSTEVKSKLIILAKEQQQLLCVS